MTESIATNMYKVIDNVLSKRDFLNIQNTCFGKLDWVYSKNIAFSLGDNPDPSQYMMNHIFFQNKPFVVSEYINLLFPILRELNVEEFFRCKANFYPKTSEVIEHEYHTDSWGNDQERSHLVALYSVNSNSGYTVLNIGEKIKVESVENRLIIFDGKIEHASTSADDDVRVNLNFCYTSKTRQKKGVKRTPFAYS